MTNKTTRRFGKVCDKHPELKGERRVSNNTCLGCARESFRRYHHADKERARRKGQKWTRDNPEKAKNKVWRRYGIDVVAARKAWDAHDGRCACCGSATPTSRGWVVDHDHASGKVRGVLCVKCNTGIGLLGDTLETVLRAVDYLQRAE